jgi:hypothetical protein
LQSNCWPSQVARCSTLHCMGCNSTNCCIERRQLLNEFTLWGGGRYRPC